MRRMRLLDQQYRYIRLMEHPLGDRSQEQASDGSHATCSHRNLVNLSLLCDANDLIGNDAISPHGLTDFESLCLGMVHGAIQYGSLLILLVRIKFLDGATV